MKPQAKTTADAAETLRPNTLRPAPGAKTARKRVGRGRGSGSGGTCGRGHKGQKSRSGGFHKSGFEGGQMPLQRRLPKRGFRSRVNRHSAEIRLNQLAKVDGDIADLQALQKAGVIGLHITRAKAILSGEINRAVTLRGIAATRGARAAIEKAGGTVEMPAENPAAAKKSAAKKSAAKHSAAKTSAAAESESAAESTASPSPTAESTPAESSPSESPAKPA